MYSGSAAFNTANQAAIQKHRLRGYIGLTMFDDSNILQGSVSLDRKNADESDIQIGAVFIGTLSMTFLKNTPITPRGWVGKQLTLEFGLQLADESWEYMPMGVFTISDATIDATGTTVTAYDAMSKFDENLADWYTTSGSIYTIIQGICNKFSVPFRMSQAQVEALPNGTKPIGLYKPNDCQTYRDIIFWISQVVGGWAEIDREGYFVLRTYPRSGTPDVNLTASDLVTGAQFSSWITDFGSVVFENEDQTTSLYGSSGVGLCYQAGMNPFLIYGGGSQTVMRTEILNTLTHIKYQPFNVSMMCAPVFDLGDVIYFAGDIAGSESAKGIVNSISYGYKNGFTISGVGSNPNLQSSMDESEKAAAESRRSASDKELEYYTYSNGTALTIGSEPVKVCDILFSADKATTVEMWHEFQIETNPDEGESLQLEAIYYMDLRELDRKPVETYEDAAKHLLDLHYMSRVYDEGSHTWQVYLVATNGTATMRKDDGLSVLKGQGIAKQDKWNGVIVLDDTVSSFSIISLIAALSETVVCTASAVDHDEAFSESVSGMDAIAEYVGLTENLVITFGWADWINFCGEGYYCGTEGVLL